MRNFLFFSFFLNVEAHAYFDPGSGSLIVQVVIGIIGGGVLFFKNIRMRLAYFLFKSKNKKVNCQKREK